MHLFPWPLYPWLGPSRGGEAGGGSNSSGWDTSGDQGHGNCQHRKRRTQVHSCPSGAPSGAACSCPGTTWSSMCACVAVPAMGHMLCSSRSPVCCSQGDSPSALPCPCQPGSWRPGHPGGSIVREREGRGGEGISCGSAGLCLDWDCPAKDSHDSCALSKSRTDQELPQLWLLSTSTLGS